MNDQKTVTIAVNGIEVLTLTDCVPCWVLRHGYRRRYQSIHATTIA